MEGFLVDLSFKYFACLEVNSQTDVVETEWTQTAAKT